MVPEWHLDSAIHDMADGDYISGSVRMMDAVLVFSVLPSGGSAIVLYGTNDWNPTCCHKMYFRIFCKKNAEKSYEMYGLIRRGKHMLYLIDSNTGSAAATVGFSR